MPKPIHGPRVDEIPGTKGDPPGEGIMMEMAAAAMMETVAEMTGTMQPLKVDITELMDQAARRDQIW